MIAALINSAGGRLGEMEVPNDCQLVQHAGGIFVRDDLPALLDNGEFGLCFTQHPVFTREAVAGVWGEELEAALRQCLEGDVDVENVGRSDECFTIALAFNLRDEAERFHRAVQAVIDPMGK